MDYTALDAAIRTVFVTLFPTVSSGDWQTGTPEERAALNKRMHVLHEVYNDKLRKTYDRHIWDGNKLLKFVGNTDKAGTDGKLEPVRAETIRKDSVSTEQPSADAMFDNLMGVETVAEVVETPAELTEG